MSHSGQGQTNQSMGGMAGQINSPVDNLTYNLITVLHTKLEGLEAYQKYMRDAQGDQECLQLFQRLQQQDSQAAQEVMRYLQQHFGKMGGRTAQ